MDTIAVLIPCYNEALTIRKVVEDYRRCLPEAVVYVYDNNSTDDTAAIAAEAGAVVRHEYQQGKGNVIRRMFREIDARCYLMVDGDDTYPAEYAPEMVRLVLDKQADMVVGDRLSATYFTENKRPFHNFGNRLVRWSINALFKSSIRDIMTGYRAFSYQFVKSFPVLSKGFEIETEMSIHAIDKNMRLETVVIFRNYKPMAFFGLLALLLAVIAVIPFLSVLLEYVRTGLVARFPTLIVSGFVAMAAILSLFSGLILQTMIHKNRQDFEMQLIRLRERYEQLTGE